MAAFLALLGFSLRVTRPVILVLAERIQRIAGDRFVMALERLM